MEQSYEILKANAENDPNILGFFVKGSRGKGQATEHSDYDIEMIVKDEVAEEYTSQYESSGAGKDDIVVKGLSEFRDYAAWGSEEAWDRYDFARVKVEVDKLDGEIQRLVDEKGSIPTDELKRFTQASLDTYINSVFRSLKCIRDNNQFGARLETAKSIGHFFSVAFALHNRLRPYGKYLAWELEQFPLEQLPWNAEEIQKDILSIAATADAATQQKLLKGIIECARTSGYQETIDGWGDILDWVLSFQKQ